MAIDLAVLFLVPASLPRSPVLCPWTEMFSFWEGGGRQTALEYGACTSGREHTKAKDLSREKVKSLEELLGLCSLLTACFHLPKCAIGALQAKEGLMVISQHWGSSLLEPCARRAGEGDATVPGDSALHPPRCSAGR